MVISCAAYGCTNRWTKEKKIQFHRFPLENPQRLRLWIKAMRRSSWTPTVYSYICSEHFAADSYKSDSYRYLRPDAVPSIFNFAAHLKRKISEKKKATRENSVGEPTIVTLKTNLKEHISSPISSNGRINGERHESEINVISQQNDNIVEMDNIISDTESESCENLSEIFMGVCAENKSLKEQLSATVEENKKHIEKISLLEQACLLQQLEVESLNNKIEELKKK